MTGCHKVPVLLIQVLLLGTVQVTNAEFNIVFTQCGLARELFKFGMPKNQLNDWACLVESESGRNTSAVGGPNVDGSYDYGLFQINNRYWCGNASRGGGCHLRCSELLTDDIAQAVGCAKLIYRLQGFSAWHGWTKKCKNRHIPDVIHCLNETSTRDPPVYSVIMN